MASNALSAARGKSNRRSLLLAMVFGALAALLVLVYLQGAKRSGKATVATVPVVYALRDIPERTVIKAGMLEVREIAVDAKHPLALSEKSIAEGQIARVPIAAGEQVLRNKIADQVRDVGFSAQVPEGKRAVAVGVTEVIASGGQIAPGDYVDVIGLFEVYVPKDKDGNPLGQSGAPRDALGKDQGDKFKPYTAVTILQNIQVLAVAQNADATLKPGEGGKTAAVAKPEQAKSVTMALTPEQAEKIFLAEEIGKIRLSLRRFGDQEDRKIPAVANTLGDLVGP